MIILPWSVQAEFKTLHYSESPVEVDFLIGEYSNNSKIAVIILPGGIGARFSLIFKTDLTVTSKFMLSLVVLPDHISLLSTNGTVEGPSLNSDNRDEFVVFLSSEMSVNTTFREDIHQSDYGEIIIEVFINFSESESGSFSILYTVIDHGTIPNENQLVLDLRNFSFYLLAIVCVLIVSRRGNLKNID